MKRQLVLSMTPARTEYLSGTASTYSVNDIGKAVKLSGDQVALCADGDEIYGFLVSVETFTQDGYRACSVKCDAGEEILATDTAGSLAVGNIVVASTAVAAGTATNANGPNVKVAGDAAAQAAVKRRWMVMAVYGAGVANQQVLLRLM